MKGRALLAWNLRALRTAKSLSQERLAIDAGVDRAWVSELEREQGNTSVDLLDRLAEALGVPIAALLANRSLTRTSRNPCAAADVAATDVDEG